MKISKTWNKVTPFSKYLAMLLFITLPFAGFYIGTEYGKQLGISNTVDTLIVPPPASEKMGEPQGTPSVTIALTQEELTLTATITAVDNACSHDGVCKVKVGNYWVITNLGGDPSPEVIKERGAHGMITVNGVRTGAVSSDMVGKTATVFAKVVGSSTLTLYGSSEYYLHIQ